MGRECPSIDLGRSADRRGVAQLVGLRYRRFTLRPATDPTARHAERLYGGWLDERSPLSQCREHTAAPRPREPISDFRLGPSSADCPIGFSPASNIDHTPSTRFAGWLKGDRFGIAPLVDAAAPAVVKARAQQQSHYRFSAFWLRSSVVSVLFRLIPETRIIDPHCVLI